MKYRFFLLTMLFCLSMADCKKDDGTIPVSNALMTHFAFKPGTYWIYQDALTGAVDSYWVSGTQAVTTANQHGSAADLYIVSISIRNPSNPDTSDYNIFLMMLGGNQVTLHCSAPFIQGSTYQFSYPFTNGQYPAYYEETRGIHSIYTNYTLNGTFYQNVAVAYDCVTDSLVCTNCPTYTDTFFINENQGILRMKFNLLTHPGDSLYVRDWQLIRCNIVK